MNIIEKHAPLKTYSSQESKWLRKPWISKGIQKCIMIKNRLYRKYLIKRDQFYIGINFKLLSETSKQLQKDLGGNE